MRCLLCLSFCLYLISGVVALHGTQASGGSRADIGSDSNASRLAVDVQDSVGPEREDSHDLLSLSHRPRRTLSDNTAMLQVFVDINQAGAVSRDGVRSGSSVSSSSTLVILALVGFPLMVSVLCLFCAAPRDGKAPLMPEAAGLRSQSHGNTGRDPRRGSEVSQAVPVATLGLPPYQSAASHPFVRCDSVSSTASHQAGILPSSHMTCDVGMLCPALIVPNAAGVTLSITGSLDAFQQELVLSVASVDVTTETILRLMVSETGRDSGILLESVLKIPIAIMETGAAVGPSGESRRPPEHRAVVIRRDMDPTRAPYAIIRAEASTCFVVTRGTQDGSPGEQLLSVLQDSRNSCANVVGADGKLIASVQIKKDSTSRVQRIIHVAQNADAALVLCAVVASVKLS